ncbi:MAG: RNA polymerase sigma factor [Chitinophagales bacterium]|nr:RNA polymerase sigma factor [Chitinophagales bacterium]HMV15036.1 RNA polymerase sigma factor [Chitinophagales bacterium]HMW12958.1 RNA polymerase sigma factor [Chitinophagales bacterium]HMX59509.1 RNA polymerase sigma factor [Chitinophagales bacterium]HMY22847.1 RNA polymerase sigma factor [Chitinophagales bacterium]
MNDINFKSEVKLATTVLKPHAMRLTSNIYDAEDLIQETIVRALVNEDKFQEGTNIKAWLFTIMKNIFINDYRKKSKRNTVIDTTANLYYINTSSTISNAGERAFVMNDIRNALMKISNELRVPFLMHYKGYKYHEIAEQLNLPLGTIKSRIFFARKELKNLLEDDYK